MKIVWLRGTEDHPELGRLEEGQEFEARDEVAAALISQGAAKVAGGSQRKRRETPAEE